MKIAAKIGFSFFAVTVICTVAALSFLYFITKNELQESVEVKLESTVRSRTAHIETYLSMLKISVGQLSKSVTLEDLLKISGNENIRERAEFKVAMTRLRRTREANPALYEFLLLDKLGKVIASSNEKNIGSDKSADAYFLGGQKEIYIKDAYYLESINEPLLAVSVPLLDSQTGELLGVLVARIKLNDLWNITAERAGLGKTGEIYIVNKYGFMITPSRFLKDTFLKQEVDTAHVRRARLHKGGEHALSEERKEMASVFVNYRGVQILGAHAYIPEIQWVVLAEIDTKEAFAPLARLRLILVEILFAMALAAWLLSWRIAKLIAGPIKKLHEGTEIIGRGNFNYKVGTDTKDEVGQLSRAFDTMTENLKTTTTSVENLNKEIAERKQAEKELKRIEWMLSSRPSSSGDEGTDLTKDDGYGDLTDLNRDGVILKSVGKDLLKDIANDYLTLMGTSSAIYEKNGDYALGIFSSNWCRFLDLASRKLCDTGDNTKALNSGKWMCHESCWTCCSKEAIAKHAPVDIECNGGIRLYAVPIFAGEEVIGVINFGYGDPPSDPAKLRAIADLYHVNYDELVQKAKSYNSRPPYVIEMAKKRLHDSAKLIGIMVEQKRMEAKLRERTAELFEREEDLAITLRSIGDAMIATDTEGRVTKMNPVAEQLTGWSLAEASGKPLETVFRIINARTRAPVQNPIAKVLASGQVVGLANHTALVARDGTVRQIADSAAPIRDAEGRIRGVVLVFHDVTTEYQIKDALRKKTEELEGFFNVALDLLCIADLKGNFIKINKAWEDILGYPVTELEQRKFLEFVHPEDMQATLDAMAELGEGKRVLNFTNRYRHKDGNYRFIEWRSNPHGNLIYAAARDITERKQVEEELRFKNLLLITQQEAAIDGILVVDGEGQIISFNRRFVELWHIPQEVIASKSDQRALEAAFTQLKNPEEFMKRVRYLYEHQHETSRNEIDLKDGRTFDRYSAPLIDNDGHYHGRVWFFRDITERKQAEQKLAQAKTDLEKAYQQLQDAFELESQLAVQAQAASAAKGQFVANISHEIRTPLNAIIGISELLIETKMSNEQMEYARTINSSAEALLNIINATLDFSKIDAGKMELEHVDFNLRNILEDIINVLAVNAAKKKLELVNFIEPNVPLNLNGDHGRLRQILFNLIGNAIKFTPAGRIEVKVELVNTDPAPTVLLRFSVQDTGIGIPADKTNLLFTAFSQVDASLARKFGGTGLGLAISKGLVEQMGGSIGVESVPGKGSTFWFIIPFSKQRSDAKPSEPAPDSGKVLGEKHEQYPPGKRLRILVAEDNTANQMVILGILEKMGHVANAVGDGKEALKTLETIPYDLVLMDIQMPEMDGLEVAGIIRDPKSAVRDHNIPILALTAHTMPEDREQCMSAGMNGYITKPVSTKSVADAIANIVSFGNVPGPKDKPVPSDEPVAVFDSKAFSDRLSGDGALIREIINIFLDETPKRMRELEKIIKKQQRDDAVRLAHTIKGSAANVSGNKLHAVAVKIEKACDSSDWREAEALVPRLNRQFEALERSMREFLKKAEGGG